MSPRSKNRMKWGRRLAHVLFHHIYWLWLDIGNITQRGFIFINLISWKKIWDKRPPFEARTTPTRPNTWSKVTVTMRNYLIAISANNSRIVKQKPFLWVTHSFNFGGKKCHPHYPLCSFLWTWVKRYFWEGNSFPLMSTTMSRSSMEKCVFQFKSWDYSLLTPQLMSKTRLMVGKPRIYIAVTSVV